jgi:peptidoglycan/xylan/chitin deacetylase (PgdA/CDA1 family)
LALPTPYGVISRTVRVPILMYHYVSSPPEDASQVRINLSLEPDDFRAQMQYLADYDYTPIDLYDVSLAITNKTELPPKPVLLTFDDGYIDAYEVVYPILEEFGFKGTFFIITEYVDAGNYNHMNWAMIEEMAAAGHRMEPHTKTHPDLSTLSWDGQIYQILGAQQTLAAHIGYTPRFLCYPAGKYNDETIAILEQLDFWGAVTTQGGKWHNFEERYEWKRLRISYTTSLGTFVDLVKPADAEN